MLKQFHITCYLLLLTFHLSAEPKAVDWVSLEAEAYILEQAIDEDFSEIFPAKSIQNKDPETKISERGFFHSAHQNTISYIHCISLLAPFVYVINSFSGFTNQANAP